MLRHAGVLPANGVASGSSSGATNHQSETGGPSLPCGAAPEIGRDLFLGQLADCSADGLVVYGTDLSMEAVDACVALMTGNDPLEL